MKNRFHIILTVLIGVLIISSLAAADAGLYPIGGQSQQQSYPIPQYNPYTQPQNQYNYNYPYYPYTAPTPTPVPYSYPSEPQPYAYPQQPYYNFPYGPYQPQPQQQGPYYDPNSGLYFYPVNPQGQGNHQPYNPGIPNDSVQVVTQWGPHGTLNVNWTVRNTTGENWDRSNVDIKCIAGCHLLSNPNQTLWDIPYTVNRNDKLNFTFNIRQPYFGDTMTVALVAGSKTLYTFTLNPF